MDYAPGLAGDRSRGFELARPGGLHILVVLLCPDRLGRGQLRQQYKISTFAGGVEIRLRAIDPVRFQERADDVADRVIIEGVERAEVHAGEGARPRLWEACRLHRVVGWIAGLPFVTLRPGAVGILRRQKLRQPICYGAVYLRILLLQHAV